MCSWVDGPFSATLGRLQIYSEYFLSMDRASNTWVQQVIAGGPHAIGDAKDRVANAVLRLAQAMAAWQTSTRPDDKSTITRAGRTTMLTRLLRCYMRLDEAHNGQVVCHCPDRLPSCGFK
jgi:hypothetical protein